jgi:hypothetical protein
MAVRCLVIAAVAWIIPSVARAQACCVGTSGLTPGWLAVHEKALVGIQLRGQQTFGSHGLSGAFYTAPPRGSDTRLEASAFASLRLLSRAQTSLIVPFVITRRTLDARDETAAAPGDTTLAFRYDFVRAGESRVPGIAAIAAVGAPTGRPPDAAAPLLAADATGIGAWEGTLGVTVEQTFGRWLVHGTFMGSMRAAREVFGVTQRLGPRGLALLAAGYVWDSEVTLVGTLTHLGELDASVGGERAHGTARRTTQAGATLVLPLSDTARLRGALFADLPFGPLGENQPAGAGLTVSMLRSFM